MKLRTVRRDSIISLSGWLFADIFLVLGIVWLGSQPFVKATVKADQGLKPQQSFNLALNTKPKVIEIPVDASGIRKRNPIALSKLHSSLDNAGLEKLQNSGSLAGLVLTFSGGDTCANHGAAEWTSRAVNLHLSKWYPNFVTDSTVSEAYVDFSCDQANRVKLKLYTFRN